MPHVPQHKATRRLWACAECPALSAPPAGQVGWLVRPGSAPRCCTTARHSLTRSAVRACPSPKLGGSGRGEGRRAGRRANAAGRAPAIAAAAAGAGAGAPWPGHGSGGGPCGQAEEPPRRCLAPERGQLRRRRPRRRQVSRAGGRSERGRGASGPPGPAAWPLLAIEAAGGGGSASWSLPAQRQSTAKGAAAPRGRRDRTTHQQHLWSSCLQRTLLAAAGGAAGLLLSCLAAPGVAPWRLGKKEEDLILG